jgi:hypothetical protein
MLISYSWNRDVIILNFIKFFSNLVRFEKNVQFIVFHTHNIPFCHKSWIFDWRRWMDLNISIHTIRNATLVIKFPNFQISIHSYIIHQSYIIQSQFIRILCFSVSHNL